MFRKLTDSIGSLRQVLLGKLLQTDLAIHSHEDVHHERDQCLIGTDIRGGFLTPDMLLAGGQSEHESSLALLVDRLPDKAARHLTHILLARGDYSAVRAPEPERHTERLRFHRDDI